MFASVPTQYRSRAVIGSQHSTLGGDCKIASTIASSPTISSWAISSPGPRLQRGLFHHRTTIASAPTISSWAISSQSRRLHTRAHDCIVGYFITEPRLHPHPRLHRGLFHHRTTIVAWAISSPNHDCSAGYIISGPTNATWAISSPNHDCSVGYIISEPRLQRGLYHLRAHDCIITHDCIVGYFIAEAQLLCNASGARLMPMHVTGNELLMVGYLSVPRVTSQTRVVIRICQQEPVYLLRLLRTSMVPISLVVQSRSRS